MGVYGVLRYYTVLVVVSHGVGEVDALRVLKKTYAQTHCSKVSASVDLPPAKGFQILLHLMTTGLFKFCIGRFKRSYFTNSILSNCLS